MLYPDSWPTQWSVLASEHRAPCLYVDLSLRASAEFWTRQIAAFALLRLCSGDGGGGTGGAVSPDTVSHHADDRFPVAFCTLALRRAEQSAKAVRPVGVAVLSEMRSAGAPAWWAVQAGELASRASEPWLRVCADGSPEPGAPGRAGRRNGAYSWDVV